MAGAKDDTAPSPPRVRRGNLARRLASAAVMVPLALGAMLLGGAVFAILLAAVLAIGADEYQRLVRGRPLGLATEIAAGGVAAAVLGFALGGWQAGLPVLAVSLVVWLIATSRVGPPRLLAPVGLIYLAVPGFALMGLRQIEGARTFEGIAGAGLAGGGLTGAGPVDTGLILLLAVVLAVWATDTGAYAAGRTVGGPKLWPRLSPSKTWSGLAGGIVAAALAMSLIAAITGGAAIWLALIVGAICAVVAQLGDLFESWLKRRAGAKDSGTIIPGHGGVLDRIDGLLAAAPVFALLHLALSGSGWWWA